MHTDIHPDLANDARAQRAAELTKACVHCGFCLEDCPTYRDYRDERDSPRGRIYLVQQLLETGDAGAATRLHLDRCLTCRSCETSCPSGMQYGELLDLGRELVVEKAPRSALARVQRSVLRRALSRPRIVAVGLFFARLVRPLLPRSLRESVPPRQALGPLPVSRHDRRVLLLEGCVQRAATPATNAAARRVLDNLGISVAAAPQAGCCGALSYHLDAQEAALDQMRRNVDAWWPALEAGAEAIVSTASGCGAALDDYARLLAHDEDYAEKARIVAQHSTDLALLLAAEDLSPPPLVSRAGRIAVHIPCTLQHAQRQPDVLPALLQRAGFVLSDTRDAHLCCGSAGTYSILQRDAARRLRDKKLASLTGDAPDVIVSANIGCQLHLQSGSDIPVRHWIELLDPAFDPAG